MTIRNIFSAVLAAQLWVLAGCGRETTTESREVSASTEDLRLKYAEGFKVSVLGNSKLVEVTYPFQGATSGYTYLLVPRGEEPPPHDPAAIIIEVPLRSIVCTSTTHIPLLDYLGETDKLIGFPTTDYISSEPMRRRIDSGKVTELGMDKDLNLERLAVLKPDAVMGYTLTGDFGQFRQMESLGIPVVINAEYLEHHPLGRAEWIKFMALFFDREQKADSVFDAIEESYRSVTAKVAGVQTKPLVLSGIVYGDAWFLPGGRNYAARLLTDAGYDYPWVENKSNGFLQLPFETVYDKAHDADFWIGTGGYSSLAAIAAADNRYTNFKAFQEKRVYNYDARQGAGGGNEFLELGYLRPDLILRDLTRIAHPQLLPDHQLFFHRKLE